MSGTSPPSEPRSGFFIHVVPAVLYVVAVFYLGSAHVSLPAAGSLPTDKLAHAVCFGAMVPVLYRALRFELTTQTARKLIIVSVVLVSALGVLLEFVQMALPYRSAELLDWVADTLGAVVAGGVLYALHRRAAQSV